SATSTGSSESNPLSLHDALPILWGDSCAFEGRREGAAQDAANGTQQFGFRHGDAVVMGDGGGDALHQRLPRERIQPVQRTPHRVDRKSTRLNSSHVKISYAVFCL